MTSPNVPAGVDSDSGAITIESRAVWNSNADYWDSHVGEGHSWVEELIWPATKRLLELSPQVNILDIGCGNGLYARRLAECGASVVAFDFSEGMIHNARRRTTRHLDRIEYRVLDATDEPQLRQLGENAFDSAISMMVLFDIPVIDPLLRALAALLRPGGTFVFSVVHPCFNSARFAQMVEAEDRDGRLVRTFALKQYEYMTSRTYRGEGIAGQPEIQSTFHRPLHVLLGSCFSAGFVLDGLEEPCFQTEKPPGERRLSWNEGLSEFPPVLVARLRRRK
ncbi:class I SAM-dependent methyltransferase [Schlesneria paludicola]|uniref:class I SAM-dependent methyltransferase n=1 Tax=Schlesneria paludicola TaxID=360056 RepID=UPI00029A0F08|nr:class I SAM-dependent methyltransferase [Schlesneria paludicola]